MKIGQYLATMLTKVCGLLFGAALYIKPIRFNPPRIHSVAIYCCYHCYHWGLANHGVYSTVCHHAARYDKSLDWIDYYYYYYYYW